MIVLKEILKWSQSRPAWQRDALRRLVIHDELSEDDYNELVEICKSKHGIADKQDYHPISKEHIPNIDDILAKVKLDSIFHRRGVNALAEGQKLSFSEGLTIVYGDNAAGKTGYTRILKYACRARRREEILGNVVSGEPQVRPEVIVKYKVGEQETLREWSEGEADDYISRVSVFDSQCATVYLTEKTDVAFRPFGLDLFDKLVKACKTVREKLESEKQVYASSLLEKLEAKIPEETSTAKLLSALNFRANPVKIYQDAQLSEQEQERLEWLEKILSDFHAANPDNLLKQLRLLERRSRTLCQHFEKVENNLSNDAVREIFSLKNQLKSKSDEASVLRAMTFGEGILEGTGTELWTNLWESARVFSQKGAYPDKQFPVVEDDACCVLCQQNLDSGTRVRLQQFEVFANSKTEKELHILKEEYDCSRKSLVNLEITNREVNEIIDAVRLESVTLADCIIEAIKSSETRRKEVLHDLENYPELIKSHSAPDVVSSKVNLFADQLQKRIKMVQENLTDEKVSTIKNEIQELKARLILVENIGVVRDEIERLSQNAAYDLCINDTSTNVITRKNTAVTKKAVTNKLKQSFQGELSNLGFRGIAVEIKEVGGAEGVFYHKLILKDAPRIALPKVVSEGQQRCLSIAAFFAELSTAEDSSGIVFDDPVSSLDYKWRDSVARRLVDESIHRQVIVFTHDIVFLLLLKQYAEQQDIEHLHQYVCQSSIGAGVCTPDLPWVALKTSARITYLKGKMQEVEKLYRDGHQERYEQEAGYIYGRLRETWERGVEEVLLNGIVERFRNSVQTKRIGKIADITDEDYKTVEIAMTKCSKWLPGHDQAAAAIEDHPEPAELRRDIEALDTWVKSIISRRKKKS